MNNANLATRATLYGNSKDRGAKFFVKSSKDGSPTSFKAIVAKAKSQVLLSVAGGCKGLDDKTREGMFGFMASALTRADGSKFNGAIMSGGTKDEPKPILYPGMTREKLKVVKTTGGKDEIVEVEVEYGKGMVTQIPSYIAKQPGFDVISISHSPKTDDLSLVGEGAGLRLNDYNATLDATGHHAMLLVQPDVNSSGDWNYDCNDYREIMEQLKAEGWVVAQVVLNGGDITRDDEIYAFLKAGIDVIVVEGSGREADAFVAAFRDGDWSKTAAEMRAKKGDAKADAKIAECKAILANADRALVQVVKMNDADALRTAFTNVGII